MGDLRSSDIRIKETAASNWATGTARKETLLYPTNQSRNITQISRHDVAGVEDRMTLGYTGYQLKDVKVFNDLVPTVYGYDPNGNMTWDAYRAANFEYNLLNLTQKVSKGSDYISYIYSADGQKLASNVNGSLTYYRGGVMVYDGSDELSYVIQPEGTVTKSQGSTTSYVYNYLKKDHVGSTRAVLSSNGSVLQKTQETDYYPTGQPWETNDLHVNKYLFGGKEIQNGLIDGKPLGMFDFHARWYDPYIPRFTTGDPMKQFASPYSYCGNNPVNLIDPTGMKAANSQADSLFTRLRSELQAQEMEYEYQARQARNHRRDAQANGEHAWAYLYEGMEAEYKERYRVIVECLIEHRVILGDLNFSVGFKPSPDQGESYIKKEGNDYIVYYDTFLGIQNAMMVHELKHAFHIMTDPAGTWSPDALGRMGADSKWVVESEIAAFKAQFAYAPYSLDRFTGVLLPVYSIFDIHERWLANSSPSGAYAGPANTYIKHFSGGGPYRK